MQTDRRSFFSAMAAIAVAPAAAVMGQTRQPDIQCHEPKRQPDILCSVTIDAKELARIVARELPNVIRNYGVVV